MFKFTIVIIYTPLKILYNIHVMFTCMLYFAGPIEIRDSTAFMPYSLDSLAKTLQPESSKYLTKWIKNCIVKARGTGGRFYLEYNDSKVQYTYNIYLYN